MDYAAALRVRIHGGSILVAIRHRHIKIGAAIEWSLTLTVEAHRDSSRLVAHVSTLISSVAMIIHRRSPCWLTANRSSTRRAFSRQAHASADGSPRTHHRNSQQLELLRGRPIHMDKRRLGESTVSHSPSKFTAIRSLRCRHIHIADPIWTDRSSALAIQVRNASSLSVTDVSTTENPASPGRPPRTHRRNSQRSECLCRRPIHIPNRASMDR